MSESLKMLMVVFNISIEDEVKEIIDKQGGICFTQWPRLVGRGKSTGPKMDNDVWPGANSAIIVVTTEKQALDIMADIQALRDEIGSHEGVKAFLLNVEKMTGEI